MTRVAAIILHPLPSAGAGPLERVLSGIRWANAARQAAGFEAVGAAARIVQVEPGGPPFGRRLREAAGRSPRTGLIVLGSGSVPLARAADRRPFLEAAGDPSPTAPALVNNRYSVDIAALPPSIDLDVLADLRSDNGLARRLLERGGAVRDLRARWRLQVDIDSPIDALVAGLGSVPSDASGRAREAWRRLAARAADPSAELVVAGRTSAAALRAVEAATASRTRAIVEERGLRTATAGQRPARSILGIVLDRDGPAALGDRLAELGDAAVVDTRVLLAHRLGGDEAGWPPAEDRFASDLLLHERITDAWLRDLTRAAAEAPIPVLLGGHTLVGPGLRLVARGPARGPVR